MHGICYGGCFLHQICDTWLFFVVAQGMKRFDAREKVAQLLQKQELWRGQTTHAMAVPRCSRSFDIIEPLLKEQWFLDCSNMATQAIKVESNDSSLLSVYVKNWMSCHYSDFHHYFFIREKLERHWYVLYSTTSRWTKTCLLICGKN